MTRIPVPRKFGNDAPLRFNIGLARQVCDGTVSRHDQPDGSVLADDAACPGLGCLVERNGFFKPGVPPTGRLRQMFR